LNNWIKKYRLFIIVFSLAITLASLFFLPRIEVNPNLDSYIPDDIENKVYLKELDSIFGGSEMIIVMLHANDVVNPKTLERLKTTSEQITDLEGVKRVMSPFDAQNIYIDDGFMVMEPFFQSQPETNGNRDTLKLQIGENPLASRFFSDDFTVASFIVLKERDYSDQALIDTIQGVIDANPGDEEVLLGGLPYVRYSISENIRKDIVYLLPLAIFLMLFMLFISFREWKGVFIPLLIVIMSIALSFGLMAILGWQISIITILLPILLIAIANDYGIHMIALYQEVAHKDPGLSMFDICKKIYADLKRPILITGLTTIGGILGLLAHTMIPAAQLGVLAAAGVGFALMLSLWFLSALLSYFKPKTNAFVHKNDKPPRLQRWLNAFSKIVTRHPKRVVIATAVLAVISIAGLMLIKVDTNIEGYFLGKSKIRKSIEITNEKFGGSQFVSIMFTGDVLDPDMLNRMEGYEEELKQDPAIGTINSPVTLIKELSKGIYTEDEAGYNQIPESADEVYQSLEMFAMAGNEETIEQFIDYNYENSRILLSLKDGSNITGKRILEKLRKMTENDPDVRLIAGPVFTKIELADLVVDGQIASLAFALLVVFILISISFKSVRAGVLSGIPLMIAIFVLFGLMGYFGIALDIATALLSSIMIGVGIDYTIHFLSRFKKERRLGHDHKEAAHITLTTTGRGIIFNALSVIIGFSALILSNFAPLRFFGALVVISITACLLSALIVIPSLIILLKPKFIDK